MTNFTLTETLLALWESTDDGEARELVDCINQRVAQMVERNIPHPFHA